MIAAVSQDDFAIGGDVPPLGKLAEPTRESLDAYDRHHLKTGVAALLSNFLGAVEVRGGEPLRITGRVAVLTGREVFVDHSAYLAVEEEPLLQAVEQ